MYSDDNVECWIYKSGNVCIELLFFFNYLRNSKPYTNYIEINYMFHFLYKFCVNNSHELECFRHTVFFTILDVGQSPKTSCLLNIIRTPYKNISNKYLTTCMWDTCRNTCFLYTRLPLFLSAWSVHLVRYLHFKSNKNQPQKWKPDSDRLWKLSSVSE